MTDAVPGDDLSQELEEGEISDDVVFIISEGPSDPFLPSSVKPTIQVSDRATPAKTSTNVAVGLFGKSDVDLRRNKIFESDSKNKIERLRSGPRPKLKQGYPRSTSSEGSRESESSPQKKNGKRNRKDGNISHSSPRPIQHKNSRTDQKRRNSGSKRNFKFRSKPNHVPWTQTKQTPQSKNRHQHHKENSTKVEGGFPTLRPRDKTYAACATGSPRVNSVDQDASYEDLLDQYKLIKLQLGRLKKEEDKRTEKGSDKNRNETRHLQSGKSGNDKENKHQRRYSRSPSKGKAKLGRGESILIVKNDKPDIQRSPLKSDGACNDVQIIEAPKSSCDEEEDEMELRRMALASRSKEVAAEEKRSGDVELVDNQLISKRRLSRENRLAKTGSPSPEEFPLDNYESVDMDLDSDCAAQATDLSEVEMDTSDDNPEETVSHEDEDETFLREQLLKSLERRRLVSQPENKNQQQVCAEELTVKEQFEPLPKSPKKVMGKSKIHPSNRPPMQSTQTLVINFGDDSSTDESDHEEGGSSSAEAKHASQSNNLLDGLDSFIRQARQKAENDPPKQLASTPAAVSKLSKAQQLEYRKLKAEIAKRESHHPQNQQQQSQQQPKATKEPVAAQINVEAAAELLRKERAHKLAACEQMLKAEKLLLNKERERLGMMQLLLKKRQLLVDQDSVRLEKLRQQVSTTEASLARNSSFLQKIGGLVQVSRTALSKHVLAIPKLERECSLTGKLLHGPEYNVPVSAAKAMLGKRRVSVGNSALNTSKKQKVTGSLVTVTVVNPQIPKVMTSAELLAEKGRLQRLEQDIALRLEELRTKSNPGSPKHQATQKVKPNLVGVPFKQAQASNIQQKLVLKSLLANESPAIEAPSNPTTTGLNSSDSKSIILSSVFEIEDLPADSRGSSFLSSHDDILPLLSTQSMKMLNLEPNFLPLENYLAICSPDDASSCSAKMNYLPSTPAMLANNLERMCNGFQLYNSSLLHLSSYRLNPRFKLRSEQTLEFNSFTHKVDSHLQLCKFDLAGTCNDDQCKWQHSKQYLCKPADVVADYLLFCPELAKVSLSDTTTVCREKIYLYANDLLKNGCENLETKLENVCNDVCRQLRIGKPHYIKFYKRRQRLKILNDIHNNYFSPEEPLNLVKELSGKGVGVKVRQYLIEDSVVDPETDIRYFQPEKGLNGFEEFLEKNPKDTRLWLKLASYHLSSHDGGLEALNSALDVLSRALETNRNDVDLWQRYLSLFSGHPDSKDILSLCQQALEFTQEYPIWWKYLELSEGFQAKRDASQDLLSFLLSAKGSSLDPAGLSHCLLEVLLYLLQLHLKTGRYNTALQILKEVLGLSEVNPEEEKQAQEESSSTLSTLFRQLVGPDQVLCWLCFCHLLIHRELPSCLFPDGTDQPSKLTNKAPFVMVLKASQLCDASLPSLLEKAILSCSKASSGDCWPLQKTLLTLHLQSGRKQSAVDMCRNICQASSSHIPAWTFLAQLLLKGSDYEKPEEVLKEALDVLPGSPELCNTLATLYLNYGQSNLAKRLLAASVKPYFDLKNLDIDCPQLLYRILLNYHTSEDIPLSAPERLETVQLLQSDIAFMWLNYVICMQCSEAGSPEILDVFESALVSVKSRSDVELIWWRYLQYSLHRKDARQTQELVFQCLRGVPARQPIPHWPGFFQLQYSFHNAVVHWYCRALESLEHRIAFCQDLLQRMPRNQHLVQRLALFQLEADGPEAAMDTLRRFLNPRTTYPVLWRMAISIAYQEKDFDEVGKLYQRALQVLPYSYQLWKDFLKLSIVENRNVESVVERCRQLGICGLDDNRLASLPSST